MNSRNRRELRNEETFRNRYHSRGRILVRPSGTENLIRVMVEGENAQDISSCAEEIAECLRKKMVG